MQKERININTLLLDIDGVVKQKGSLIPNISELLQRIIEKGIKIKFVTNCSLHKLYHFDEKILPGYTLEIIDPLDVLLDLIKKNPSLCKHQAIVIGTKDIKKRISGFGIKISDGKKANNVFIFEKLIYDQEEIVLASRSVLNGAKLYCAGIDQLFWYNGEVYPGVGAITEQIKFMTQTKAIVLGKPSKAIYELAMYQTCNPDQTVFVGDEFHIDILGAKKCGLLTAYLTSNSPVNNSYMSKIDMIDASLNSFVKKYL